MYANISFIKPPPPTSIKIRSPIPRPSKNITGVFGYLYRLLFFAFYRLKSSLCYKTVYIESAADLFHPRHGMGILLTRQYQMQVCPSDAAYDCQMDELDPTIQRRQPESLDWMVKNTRFTKRELQAFYRGFKQENPLGYMTLNQVKAIFSAIFVHGNSEQYATLVFQSFDRTLPDQITFMEFALALSRLLRGTLDEKLEWIFTLYDQKGDGIITFDEMYGVVKALYNNMGIMVEPPPDRFVIRQHALDMFKKFDINERGHITKQEFIQVCKEDDVACREIMYGFTSVFGC